MKKVLLIATVIAVSFGTISCEKKKQKKQQTEKGFQIDTNRSEVTFLAYKTTDKVPVKGKFKTINITNASAGKDFKDALDGTEFSIPVSSLFTNNVDRDYKLKTLFFGVMKNTELLSGTIHIVDATTGFVDFAMNGIIEKLPFSYTSSEKSIEIKSVMNTDTWQAQSAIASINNACFELHKGADGISKTWSDVAIDIAVYFK